MKNITYPLYRKTETRLYCFQSPTKMYKIEAIGTNMNPGMAIDHYITRNMVLKHLRWGGTDITEQEFITLYQKLFSAILQKMTSK